MATRAAFPADRRMVIVWGHSRGVGWDLKLPRRLDADAPPPRIALAPVGEARRADRVPDGLTIANIRALIDKGKDKSERDKLDLLWFDSCYMANAEFSYELSGGVCVPTQRPAQLIRCSRLARQPSTIRRSSRAGPCLSKDELLHRRHVRTPVRACSISPVPPAPRPELSARRR
jgi:hypothetical protein